MWPRNDRIKRNQPMQCERIIEMTVCMVILESARSEIGKRGRKIEKIG
jgi:hypothetical protein